MVDTRTTTDTVAAPETAVTLDLAVLPVPAFSVDRRHRITACNAAAERLFGCEASAIIGQRCSKIMTSLLSAACLSCDQWCGRQVARPSSGGAEGASTIRLRRGDSSERLHINVLLAQAASGEPRYVHLLHVLPAQDNPVNPSLPAGESPDIPREHQAEDRPNMSSSRAEAASRVGATSRPRSTLPLSGNGDHHLLEPPPVHLTSRELGILHLLAEGLTTQEIADRSCITYSTARNHISSIIAKLGAATRLHAVHLAREQSLL